MGVFPLRFVLSRAMLWTCALFLVGFPQGRSSGDQAADKPELNILALFPMSGKKALVGNSALVVADLAIEQINNRTDILPNHTLRLFWRDSQCAAGPGIDGLYDLLYTPPVKHVILGASCSIVCQPVAEISPRWNLTQVAYGCSSPSLSNKDKYPRFFRVVAPESSFTEVRTDIIRMLGWNKIATFHQSYEIFSTTIDALLERLGDFNVTALLSAAFLTNPTQQVENLKNQHARIIFTGFYEDAARKVFCEVYKKGIYGPKFAWFGVYWYPYTWWSKEDTECSAAEMLEAVDGMLYIGMPYENPENKRGFGGVSHTELMELYDKRTEGREVPGREKIPAHYDGLWTVALALDRTVKFLNSTGSSKKLEDFTYADSDIGNIMMESVAKTDFQGVMGSTKFDKNGDPSSFIAVDQQQGEQRVKVAYYQPATEKQGVGRIIWVNGGIKWRGWRPPRDSTIVLLERVFISTPLYLTACTFAVVGLVATALLFAFNLKFRTRSFIKMSSPNINNVILTGCWLAYCTVFLQEMPGSTVKENFLCVSRSYTFLIGFSLALGALFSKTWRVHRVLTTTRKTLAKVVIKDSALIGIVLALVLVNVVILTIREIVDPLTVKIKDLDRKVRDPNDDVEVVPQIHICSSNHEVYFTGALYVIQGMVLAFGAFLAWETRNVKVEALNDSKQIGVCIYNVLTLSVLGTAVSLLVDDDVDVSYGFTSAITILGTAFIQCTIFVPKLLGIKHGKIALNQVSSTSGVATASVGLGSSLAGSNRETTTTGRGRF